MAEKERYGEGVRSDSFFQPLELVSGVHPSNCVDIIMFYYALGIHGLCNLFREQWGATL